MTKIFFCTASSVGITGENLTWGLVPELIEIPSKEDKRFSMTRSTAKSTDGSKSLLNSGTSIEKNAEAYYLYLPPPHAKHHSWGKSKKISIGLEKIMAAHNHAHGII
ncbi:hypothetical protein AYI68_g1123 [Smittium mucronatum]|uniref:Uncharacterized protein n=1 Tax=Smittium mucronatum TaxID=133383 RepID=A0A1R0H6J5_9FUNG|nr:hypothetical protein AYI68_g1123 [Smittium mucronatum]